ncbi:pirin family protein [Nocardioides sp. 1609]|uniref:pirin family protein n=1 Tax=Nocardioides sp. 1609 TaxID=2508327 RepID=UPI001430CCEF|nr:pirin family protein [Nocardioides sp. 1609]
MSVEIRRGTGRSVERETGRLSRHSFSFGSTYDPDNLRFGPMVCHDDHLLGPGRGFDTHRHSNLVIVSYVVSGALRHTGPTGSAVVGAGRFAVLHTGDGTDHSEVADEGPTRFVQTWLTDDDGRAADAASYDVLDGVDRADGGGVDLPGARLTVVRLSDGETGTLPAAPLLHVYVVRGALLRSSLAEPLQEGDAFRFTDEPAHEVTAGVDTELLVWAFA